MLSDSLLGGGYLRLPMPQTVGVVTLRALCQEREEEGASRDWAQETANATKKTRGDIIADITSLRGRLPTLPLSQYHRRGEA